MLIATAAAITCALLVGAYPAFVLAIGPHLARHLQADEPGLRIGLWIHLAMVPMLVISGVLVDWWGDKQLLYAGLLLTAAGFASLGMCRKRDSTSYPLLMLGSGAACVTIATILLLPRVFFVEPMLPAPALGASVAGLAAAPFNQGPLLANSVLYPQRPFVPAASLNLGFAFAAAGFFLLPVLLDYLCRRQPFQRAMYFFALCCIVPGLLVAITPARFFPPSHPDARLDQYFADPRLWTAALILLLYLPLERSLGIWADRYLTEMDYEPSQIPRWLAAFWLVFVLARLAAAVIIPPGFEMWFVLALVLAATFTLGNLVGYVGSASGGHGMLIIAACFGPIFPTLLGVVILAFPDAPATVLGIVLAGAVFANAVLHPALVRFARTHSIQATIKIPMFTALLLAAPTLMLTLLWVW